MTALPSWHHHLRGQGYTCDSIGKLHFKGRKAITASVEVEPLHVYDGTGDVLSCIRDNPPFRDKVGELSRAAAATRPALQHDARCAEHAQRWLADHQNDDKPWAVFLNFVCPHPPYIAPPDLYERYETADVALPPQCTKDTWPKHPVLYYFRRFFRMEDGHDEETLRRVAAAYMGTTTYLDQQIGAVLDALDGLGLSDSTRVIYSSDHGECLGARGLFGKFTMYDEAAAVPLIAAGPDVPEGHVVETPVSLIDIFPTALECVGADAPEAELPGRSLWLTANEDNAERTVLSEYHALALNTPALCCADAATSDIYYVVAPPQLFDLREDPDELNDLSTSSAHRTLVADFERELRSMLRPRGDRRAGAGRPTGQVERCGGEDAVRAKGAFDHSPTPGEQPAFRTNP